MMVLTALLRHALCPQAREKRQNERDRLSLLPRRQGQCSLLPSSTHCSPSLLLRAWQASRSNGGPLGGQALIRLVCRARSTVVGPLSHRYTPRPGSL